jgi:hypothetical protein
MTANHLTLSHTRLVTLINIEFVPGVRNRALLNPTMLNNSGIQIHERLISQFFTTFTNGVQGIHVTATHPTRSMHVTLAGYLIYVRNDGIHVVLFENSYFYNKVHIEPVEA